MDVILTAVRDAAKLCRLVQKRYLSAETKTAGDHSEPVTIADYGSQAIICRALQQHYPDDAVVAEESSDQYTQLVSAEQRAQILTLLSQVLRQMVSEAELLAWLDFGAGHKSARTWVIDPIDGTKGFLARRHYAIACGLLLEGQVADGIVAAPGYDDGAGALFYTQDGSCYRAPLASGAGSRVTVSSRSKPADIIAAQSFERAHASKSRMARARELAGLSAAPASSNWTAWRNMPWSPAAMPIYICACRAKAAATLIKFGIMPPASLWYRGRAAQSPTLMAVRSISPKARPCLTPA